MTTAPTGFETRLSPRTAVAVWGVWLLFVVVLSVPALRYHLAYAYQGHTGIFWLYCGVLTAAATLVPPLYQRWRRRGWWRHEPVALAGAAVGVPLLLEPLATAVTIWLFLAAYGAGRFVRECLGLEPRSPIAELTVSFALGFGLLVWPLTALGFAGWYRAWTFAALLTVLCAAFHRQIRRLWSEIGDGHRRWRATPELGGGLIAALIVVVALLLGCGLMVALSPTISYDPLTFHLPLARHYAAVGELTPLDADNYGYNPQGFEMMLALGYALARQAGTQLISPAFFGLFLIALAAVSRECGFSRPATVIGVTMAAALPYFHWTGVSMKHDLIVAFLHLAGLFCFLRWRREGEFRWIQLGVFLAAMSLSFKHPAAFGVLGLAPLFVFAAWRQPKRLRAFASCGLIFFLLGSFWMIRSYVNTADPFVYYNFTQPLPPDHAEQVGSAGKRLLTAVTWPYKIHFDGGLFFRSFTNSPAGVFLVLAAPLWLLLRRREASFAARACAVFTGVALVTWSLYVPLLRFVVAPMALLVVFTADRLEAWYRNAGRWTRLPVRIAVGYSLLFSLLVITVIEINGPQFRYFTGALDRTGYLREALLTYRSLEALARTDSPDAPVLSVRNCSRGYAPNPNVFVCGFDHPEAVDPFEAVRPRVNDKRFEYLILPARITDEQSLRDLSGGRSLEPLHRDPHFTLYRLDNAGSGEGRLVR